MYHVFTYDSKPSYWYQYNEFQKIHEECGTVPCLPCCTEVQNQEIKFHVKSYSRNLYFLSNATESQSTDLVHYQVPVP